LITIRKGVPRQSSQKSTGANFNLIASVDFMESWKGGDRAISFVHTYYHSMHKIPEGYILPSAAYTISAKQIKYYEFLEQVPEIGDVVYGKVLRLGQHAELENKSGRIHRINEGSTAIFVFGNRYAPDFYEGFMPETMIAKTDLLARSGLVGDVQVKNSSVNDPTRIKILGYVCSSDGKVLNTRDYSLIKPNLSKKKEDRAKLLLFVGTSMNAGKSTSAIAACWALSTMGYTVRASKVTGTASLKDILHMQDAGASIVNDFTHFGFPSTYLLEEREVLTIFNDLDLKYANNPKNYWVVELADGILQRETALLLQSEDVRSRIYRLVFAAHDTFGAVGGLNILKQKFGLVPDAISGVCSSSPLALRELSEYTDIPVYNNINWNLKQLSELFR
jgi:hypothetical protein